MLSYSVITPVRDESVNLPRLADSILKQTYPPALWLIVDNGSTDGTVTQARSLEQKSDHVRLVELPGNDVGAREATIGRAMTAGIAFLTQETDVIVKVDADTSFDGHFFERLVSEFDADPRLGIASGTGYEQQRDGVWQQRHGTGSGVWGACRAYRRECLATILPLDERVGWDGIDVMKAELRGWRTRVLAIPFHHHRPEGARDGSGWKRWVAEGGLAHYLRYRLSYLWLRTVFRSVRDIRATGILVGYLSAALRGAPRSVDPEVLQYVRTHQSVRNLPRRIKEASRRRELLRGDPEREAPARSDS